MSEPVMSRLNYRDWVEAFGRADTDDPLSVAFCERGRWLVANLSGADWTPIHVLDGK